MSEGRFWQRVAYDRRILLLALLVSSLPGLAQEEDSPPPQFLAAIELHTAEELGALLGGEARWARPA